MNKESILAYISLLIDRGFFGKVVLSLQNGKVDTIKQEESLKEQDVKRIVSSNP